MARHRRGPRSNPPRNFSQTSEEDRRDRGSDSKPSLAPAPCPLYALCPPLVQGPSTPPAGWAPAPAPAVQTSSSSGNSDREQTSAAASSASPAPSASSRGSRPPLVGPDRTCGDSGGWAGPAWAVRLYAGALPPSVRPLPLHVRGQRGKPRARCPRTRVGHGTPTRALARTSPARRGARSGPRRQAGTAAYLGMVEVEQQSKAPMHPREQKVHGFGGPAGAGAARAPSPARAAGWPALLRAQEGSSSSPSRGWGQGLGRARGWSTVCAHSRLTGP